MRVATFLQAAQKTTDNKVQHAGPSLQVRLLVAMLTSDINYQVPYVLKCRCQHALTTSRTETAGLI